MYRNLLSLLTVLVLFPSCTHTPPNISVVCEENNIGNNVIKWEVIPLLEGEVKVYASSDPDHIPEKKLVGTANIADGHLTIVADEKQKRSYYLMVFDDKYRVKVATRNINIPGIQNFRDLGGYRSQNTDKVVRWGMLYRSAQIDSVCDLSVRKLKSLGIKTIIDLRSEEELVDCPRMETGIHTIHIPISTGNVNHLLKDIKEGRVKVDSIYYQVEQANREIILKHGPEFHRIFEELLDVNNYPLVLHCSSGKGRTGIVSALILTALGVNEDIVMEDYRLSNEYFNIPKASRYAYSLPDSAQEAITTIFSAKEDFLNAAKEVVVLRYGSVNNYLKEVVGLTDKDLKQLKKILLEEKA